MTERIGYAGLCNVCDFHFTRPGERCDCGRNRPDYLYVDDTDDGEHSADRIAAQQDLGQPEVKLVRKASYWADESTPPSAETMEKFLRMRRSTGWRDEE